MVPRTATTSKDLAATMPVDAEVVMQGDVEVTAARQHLRAHEGGNTGIWVDF